MFDLNDFSIKLNSLFFFNTPYILTTTAFFLRFFIFLSLHFPSIAVFHPHVAFSLVARMSLHRVRLVRFHKGISIFVLWSWLVFFLTNHCTWGYHSKKIFSVTVTRVSWFVFRCFLSSKLNVLINNMWPSRFSLNWIWYSSNLKQPFDHEFRIGW